MYTNSTGSYNTALGKDALRSNTTASNNTAVGYQAGYSNQTGAANTFIGYQAGYSTTGGPNGRNVFVGEAAGYSNTSGRWNTYIGHYAGQAMTTGQSNTIIGRYDGNQFGLDIRTANNYIVLSDGDGNPRMQFDSSGFSFQQGTAFYNKKLVVEGSPNLGSYKGYLILAKAYVSGLQNKSVVQGTFTLIRGSTGSGERNDVYYVDSSSGYNGDTFSVKVQSGRDSFFVQTVKVTYGGVVYHAIETSVSGGEPDNGVWFNGFYYNCSPIYTDATYCSSITAYGYADASNLNETQALYLQNGRLQFPATQNASSNANTLDDYEEGSFTSTVTYSTTLTATPPTSTTTITGYYTKIGNVVTCTFPEITKATFGGSSVIISNFTVPFSSSNNGTWATNAVGFYNIEGQYGGAIVNTNVTYMVQVQPNSTTMNVIAQTTNLGGGAYWRLVDASSSVRFSITYRTP
jgi:hypothetical protein